MGSSSGELLCDMLFELFRLKTPEAFPAGGKMTKLEFDLFVGVTESCFFGDWDWFLDDVLLSISGIFFLDLSSPVFESFNGTWKREKGGRNEIERGL